MTVGVVLVIYRVVPPRAPALARRVPPAIVAGRDLRAEPAVPVRGARVVGVAALAGPLATAFIALAWLSFSFQILLYGAAWVRVRDDEITAGDEGSSGGDGSSRGGGPGDAEVGG